MFRFTIRELLLLTVVAALAVGWVLERRRSERWERRAAVLENEVQNSRLAIAELHQDISKIEQELPPHGLALIWSRDLRPSVQKLAPRGP